MAGYGAGAGYRSGSAVGYRCEACGNERDFHRFYVEEAKELLTEAGEWETLEAWEFDDGAYTTYGAICTLCKAAGRDDDVVEIDIVEVKEIGAAESDTRPQTETEED